jgi:hypothetical protein
VIVLSVASARFDGEAPTTEMIIREMERVCGLKVEVGSRPDCVRLAEMPEDEVELSTHWHVSPRPLIIKRRRRTEPNAASASERWIEVYVDPANQTLTATCIVAIAALENLGGNVTDRDKGLDKWRKRFARPFTVEDVLSDKQRRRRNEKLLMPAYFLLTVGVISSLMLVGLIVTPLILAYMPFHRPRRAWNEKSLDRLAQQ